MLEMTEKTRYRTPSTEINFRSHDFFKNEKIESERFILLMLLNHKCRILIILVLFTLNDKYYEFL